MTTEELIKKMRKIMPVGPITQNCLKEAANRLEEVERELVRLRRVTTRLKIAAIVWAGMQHKSVDDAVKLADQLIAAAKEAK